MSVNKYKPHLYVIPEDDADRQIADGFMLHEHVQTRRVQVVEPAGGWARVLQVFTQEYLRHLQQYSEAYVVMLIDFDGTPDERLAQFVAEIPEEVRDRVFVVGPRDTPERLRQSLGRVGYEDIGHDLANECDGGNLIAWASDQLQHNEQERLRLANTVKPFLFRG